MQANYQAILSECIERGIMQYMRSMDLVDPVMLQTLETNIWLEIDTFFTFDGDE
jgi:hypothetical protein